MRTTHTAHVYAARLARAPIPDLYPSLEEKRQHRRSAVETRWKHNGRTVEAAGAQEKRITNKLEKEQHDRSTSEALPKHNRNTIETH